MRRLLAGTFVLAAAAAAFVSPNWSAAHYYFLRLIANPTSTTTTATGAPSTPTVTTQWRCVTAAGATISGGGPFATKAAAEAPCGVAVSSAPASATPTHFLEESVVTTTTVPTTTTVKTRREEVYGGSTLKVADAHAQMLMMAGGGGVVADGGSDADLPACEFYISTNGTGTAGAGGTVGDPWGIAMLRNATAQARYAGNVVCLGDGTYCIPVEHTDFSQPYWNITGGSDDNNRTVVRATNARQAVLRGLVGCSGTTYTEQALIGTDDPYVTIMNLEVKEGSAKLIQILADNVTIDGVWAHDLDNTRGGACCPTGDNTDLIRLEEAAGSGNPALVLTNIIIRNSLLTDSANQTSHDWADGTPNASAVKQYYVQGLIFENNRCERVASCINEKIGSRATIARYNFCYNVRTCIHGLGTSGSDHPFPNPQNYTAVAYQNIAINSEKLYDTENTVGGANGQFVQLYNNTYYGNDPTGNGPTVMAFRGTVADRVDAKNNIFYMLQSSGYGLVHSDGVVAVNTYNYNLYPGVLRWMSGSYTTLAAWRSATGLDVNSATTNPNFANPGGTEPEDYKISGAALTAGDTGGPVGAWITGSEQIGIDW